MAQNCLPPPSIILPPPPHPPKGRLAGVPLIRCTPSRPAPSSVLTQNPSPCVSPVRVWPREVPLAPVRIRVQCCHGWAQEGSAPVRGTPNRLGWTYGARAYGTQPVTSRPRMALCAVPHVVRGRQILAASRSGTSVGAFILALRNVASSSSAGRVCRGSPMPVLKPRGGWRARVDGTSSEARGVLRHSTWSWALWVSRMEGCCKTTPRMLSKKKSKRLR